MLTEIENLFEQLSVAKSIRALVKTDQFVEPIELLGLKSDFGNMRRHPIGLAFSKNSKTCNRGFFYPLHDSLKKTSGIQGTYVVVFS